MRDYREPYQKGGAIEYNEEPGLQDSLKFTDDVHKPGSKPDGKRIGTIDNMAEGEEPGGIADQNDESIRNAAMEQFANKMKRAVSAKLMGRKTKLSLKGDPQVVQQVTNLIKYESEYLDAIMSGQAADTPALQKNKAIIDREAKKLDRMLGTTDLWPFK